MFACSAAATMACQKRPEPSVVLSCRLENQPKGSKESRGGKTTVHEQP